MAPRLPGQHGHGSNDGFGQPVEEEPSQGRIEHNAKEEKKRHYKAKRTYQSRERTSHF